MTTYTLHPKSWAKIASKWYVYETTNTDETKECTVCWEMCSKYLSCSNSTEHIICSNCTEHIVENNTYVQPNASISIKWKCPLCRHENPIGAWQFLSSSEKAKKDKLLQQVNMQGRNQIRLNTEIQNTSRYTWIKSLNWKNSVVNHFKAWIMYNDTTNFIEGQHNEKSLSGFTLSRLKEQHNYNELRYSSQAPWYKFLNELYQTD
jgi:hypothetical protein